MVSMTFLDTATFSSRSSIFRFPIIFGRTSWSRLLQNTTSPSSHIHFRSRCCPCPILWGWQKVVIAKKIMAPGRCDCNFRCISFEETLMTDILSLSWECEISLRWKPQSINKSALVQVMAWCNLYTVWTNHGYFTSHTENGCWCLGSLHVLVISSLRNDYCQTSSISCNKIVDHSDVVRASPVGAAPTTSSFSTWTPGFNGLDKGNWKMRRESFTFGDLVCLILDVLQYAG